MKLNIPNSLKLAVIATLAAVQVAKADYNITFSTFGVNNPVFDVGGSVANSGSYLVGTAFKAQLYVAQDAAALATADASAAIGVFKNFLTGGGAGFINGGTVSVTSGTLNAGNNAVYQIKVWEAAYSTFEIARGTTGAKIGESAVTSITLGGTVPGNPPTLITAQANLHGAFGLTAVPEPATLAFGLFGAAGLLFRRRK